MNTTVPRTTGFAPRSNESDFRELMASFPTGVSVVTATGTGDVPMGLTCSSLSSVCVDPPTLMVCLNVSSATLAAAVTSGRFGVNLLHDRAAAAARTFSGLVLDRFAAVTWRWSWLGLPWLCEDAFAFADCVVAGHYRFGDHEAVFGEVSGIVVAAGDPLLYGRRGFASWSAMVVQ